MGRAKLSMEFLAKEKVRNTTFLKRKQGLIKKANEFKILCDVETVMIIYGLNSQEPEIWPQDPETVMRTINAYKQKKGECGKRIYTLKDFFEDRNKKAEEELAKARKKNMEFKRPTWFDELNSFSEAQLRQFAIALENKEKVVRARVQLMKRNSNEFVPFKFELENKPVDHFPMPIQYAPAPSFDNQAHVVHHHQMSHVPGFLNHNNDAPMSHNDVGRFNVAPMTPFMKRGLGFDPQPFGMEGGGVIYNVPWTFCGPTFQQPMMPMAPFLQCALPPNLPPQVLDDSQVNNDQYNGVGEFQMNNQRGKF